MPRRRRRRGKPNVVKQLQRQVARLSDTSGHMQKLPNGPLMNYRNPFHSKVRILVPNTVGKYEPYQILNGANSALLLKFNSVRFESLDISLSGSDYSVVQFFDHKAVQSGSNAIVSYGDDDANRFECFNQAATGEVQNFRIHFPIWIRDQWFDVNDKLTPIFKIASVSSESSSMLIIANTQLRGYAYLPPQASIERHLKYLNPEFDYVMDY